MIWQRKEQVAGAYSGEAQHMLGPENPLKSIDFTGPEAGLAPIALPLNTPLVDLIKKIIIMFLF